MPCMYTMKVISVAVDDDIHRLARIKAAQKGTSMSAMLRDYLMQILLEDGDRVPEETEPQRRARKLDDGERSTPPCRRRPGGPVPRYSSPTRPISVRTPNPGASGRCGESRPCWTGPARAIKRRPATTRRCAWRRGRWSGWNGRGKATPEPRLPP